MFATSEEAATDIQNDTDVGSLKVEEHEGSPKVQPKKLSHDPSVTLEYVVECGGGDEEELRLSKELHRRLPTARPDQVVRFLRARKGNVDIAAKMLGKHLEWRSQNLLPPVDPQKEDGLKEEILKAKICFFGTDTQGRKVVVLRGRLLGKHTYANLHIAKRALYQMGEVMESRCEPLEKVTILSSGRDTTHRNNDFDWLKEVAHFFQHNYPERLAQVHSAPTPLFTRVFWGIAKYFFDTDTRAKVFLHGGADACQQYVSMEELHEELGGNNNAPLSAEDLLCPVHIPPPLSGVTSPTDVSVLNDQQNICEVSVRVAESEENKPE